MSDSTPILMTLSEICACAAPATNAPATATAIKLPFSLFIAFLLVDRGSLRNGILNPKIFVQLFHIRIELRIRDHVDDTTVLEHVVPVGNRRCEAEILLDQQNRETLAFEPRDRASDLLDDHRRQTFGRLVQQQQPRAGAQYPADREHLLLTAR